eukprot:SM000058S18528  [mRNA]  locus=s58:367216:368096:- [translate_table: standard]
MAAAHYPQAPLGQSAPPARRPAEEHRLPGFPASGSSLEGLAPKSFTLRRTFGLALLGQLPPTQAAYKQWHCRPCAASYGQWAAEQQAEADMSGGGAVGFSWPALPIVPVAAEADNLCRSWGGCSSCDLCKLTRYFSPTLYCIRKTDIYWYMSDSAM